MKLYAIKHRDVGKEVAKLRYDEGRKEFHISISGDAKPSELPIYLALHAKKGIYEVDGEHSLRWVRDRLVPPDRQNIGQILKAKGLKYYDEHELLVKYQGRTTQDEFMIEEI